MKTISLPPYSEFIATPSFDNLTTIQPATGCDIITDLQHYYRKAIMSFRYRGLRLTAKARSRKIGRLIGMSTIYIMGLTIIALQLRSLL